MNILKAKEQGWEDRKGNKEERKTRENTVKISNQKTSPCIDQLRPLFIPSRKPKPPFTYVHQTRDQLSSIHRGGFDSCPGKPYRSLK